MSDKPLILLVDDNPGDVELTKIAFEVLHVDGDFEEASDGAQAIARLEAAAKGERPPPDLVILDLNMPRVNGIEVLAHVQRRPELQKIPIVVLTTSSSPQDFARCRELGAIACHTKPSRLEDFLKLLRQVAGHLKRG